jgi:hypothetical protein
MEPSNGPPSFVKHRRRTGKRPQRDPAWGRFSLSRRHQALITAGRVRLYGSSTLRMLPQPFSDRAGINLVFLPPAPFITSSVILGVVNGA